MRDDPTGGLPAPARLLIRPFQRFAALEASGGILLIASTIVAMLAANSPYATDWHHLWETPIAFGAGDLQISKTLHHWINDGLMAVFFFVVGLEIKREVLIGELSTARKAALPMAAALGGMVVPAGFYYAFNGGTEAASGWGIPMATDIAFALGVLMLLGKRAPTGLKVFLTALAIVDDLGAVLVIAVFYTAELSVVALGAAALFLGAMFVLNLLHVRYPLAYLVLGIALWGALVESGVHGTVAGVLGALAIPVRRRIAATEFVDRARDYLAEIEQDLRPGMVAPTPDQRDAIHSLEQACEEVETPLARLEHDLHPLVAYAIIPLFALSNAGVPLGAGVVDSLMGRISLGIIVGLIAGKQIGVMLFAWLAVKLGLADLPSATTWRHMYGAASLCGIGFTMSLFIANLALGSPAQLDIAKTAILAASVISGGVGWLILRLDDPPE
jgi:NhaA family Na+:H+ antiporter